MAELQTITAVANLVQLALSARNLIHRVRGAELEADILSQRTTHLTSLAKSIEYVVGTQRDLHNVAYESSQENSLYELVEESLDECRKSLKFIDERLQPFQDKTKMTMLSWCRRNIDFVRMADFRKQHESMIDQHFQTLSLLMILLISHDLHTNRSMDANRVANLNRIDQNEVTNRQRQQRALAQGIIPPAPGLINLQVGNETDRRCLDRYQHDQEHGSDSPLTVAIKAKGAAGVQRLIHDDVGLGVKDATGRTFLHHVAENLDEGVLKALFSIRKTKDPGFLNEQTLEGKTALMIAADNIEDPTSFQIAIQLIQRRCDVNLKDTVGRSALYITIDGPLEEDRIKFAEILCGYGADLEAIKKQHRRGYDRLQSRIRSRATQSRRNSSATKYERTSVSTASNHRRNSEAQLVRVQTEPTRTSIQKDWHDLPALFRRRRPNSTS